MHDICAYLFVYVCVCARICVLYVCMHVCAGICVCICMMRVPVCTFVYMCVCMYMCVYVRIHCISCKLTGHDCGRRDTARRGFADGNFTRAPKVPQSRLNSASQTP